MIVTIFYKERKVVLERKKEVDGEAIRREARRAGEMMESWHRAWVLEE